MEIRLATPNDTSEIVQVLRSSLGESKLPKTEEIWNYKHVSNPFGPSIVLVAILEGKIVGVRAFMRWTWQYGANKLSSLRAVDTATLPEFQGRGIFKKLTLKAVEIATKNGDHLVFNTPNTQSMPGYLKMGWSKINKLNIEIFPCNPLNWKTNGINYSSSSLSSVSQLQDLTQRFNLLQQSRTRMFTPKSSEYLDWRYYRNPLQKYQTMAEPDFFISGYIKSHKFAKELRITEAIYVDECSKNKMRSQINAWAKIFGVQVISITGSTHDSLYSPSFRGKFGPVLTLRNLNLDKEMHREIQQIKNWEYSLGDLELF